MSSEINKVQVNCFYSFISSWTLSTLYSFAFWIIRICCFRWILCFLGCGFMLFIHFLLLELEESDSHVWLYNQVDYWLSIEVKELSLELKVWKIKVEFEIHYLMIKSFLVRWIAVALLSAYYFFLTGCVQAFEFVCKENNQLDDYMLLVFLG